VIRLEQFSVRAGSFTLRDVSLEVPAGGYGILMGRTGSGKTTLLEAVCGLKPVTGGRVVLCGRDVTRLKPGERGVGFVPQDGALFPTMTVGQQLGFALTVRRWPPEAIRARVRELADVLGIAGLLDRTPQGLSGGERQRVALGRALSFRPGVLCLDEPLSALDESTREDICELLESVTRQTGVTTLHITHSRREADRLGDIVFRLKDGRLEPAAGDDDEAMLPDAAETPA
jgi:ABC-type sugar transport system ATPase subunit